MRNSKILGEAIGKSMKEQGLRQVDMAGHLHVDRSTLSKYINGNPIPDDILGEIVRYLKDPLVRLLAYGTTSSIVYLDKIKIDGFRNQHRGKIEMEEAVDAIEKSLSMIHNFNDVREMNDLQKQQLYKAIEEVIDAKLACEIINVAASKMGVDLDSINRKCVDKWIKRGYLSKEFAKAQGAF